MKLKVNKHTLALIVWIVAIAALLAGIAAVMANGMEHIKALADYVSEADCDHDGVAEIFRKLVL